MTAVPVFTPAFWAVLNGECKTEQEYHDKWNAKITEYQERIKRWDEAVARGEELDSDLNPHNESPPYNSKWPRYIYI